MARVLALVLALMVGGLWVINGWLMANVWRFLLWWGACAALTGFLLLFACYDLLAVIPLGLLLQRMRAARALR